MNIFKAANWKPGYWLIFLCVFEVMLIIIYLAAHSGKTGHEYVQLDKKQTEVMNGVLLMYPDTGQPSSILYADSSDTAKQTANERLLQLRKARAESVIIHLETAYDGNVEDTSWRIIRKALVEFNAKDCGIYLSNLKIKVKSYFWLSDGDAYYEIVFWCLVGVFTSLIFYVGQRVRPCDPAEAFDPNEISNQVAKMFYAPVTTLVLVIGYHLVGGSDANMIDITVNKGVILFAFLSGFYSGRVMKLLDKIKELLLPATADAKAAPAQDTVKLRATVKLTLAESLAKTPEGAEITEIGFNSAVVTLTPDTGGDAVILSAPEEDQGNTFTANSMVPGKYTLSVQYAHKNAGGDAITNLDTTQTVDLQKNDQEFVVVLEKADHDG